MSCLKWQNPSGEVIAMVSNEEYLLLIDFERGIQVDASPNHETIRWEPFLEKKSFESVLSEYNLSDTPPREEDWLYREYGNKSLTEIQQHILELFISEMELLGKE